MAGAKLSRAHRLKPTRARSWRDHASRRIRFEDDVGRLRFRERFSRKKRGHAFMLMTQTTPSASGRRSSPAPACCHASIAGPYKKAGDGDLMKGFEKFNQMPFAEARRTSHASGRLH